MHSFDHTSLSTQLDLESLKHFLETHDLKISLAHIAIAIHDIESWMPLIQIMGFLPSSFSRIPPAEIVASQFSKVWTFPLILPWQNWVQELIPADQRHNWPFLPVPQIEFLAPSEEQGPIFDFLQKRGPGLHHLSFWVPNLEQTVEALKSIGIKMIGHQASVGVHGDKIWFAHPKSTHGVLLEFQEYQSI
jgi:methylmalonyl-CoA epimerase